MNSSDIIFNYLKDTRAIGQIVDKFLPLDPDSDGKEESLLAPWSIDSICLNTGLNSKEVSSVLSGIENGSFINIGSENHGLQIFSLEGNLPQDSSKIPERTCATEMTVSELMNLYLYQYAGERIMDKNYPVKIEEALFDLKNSIFLPDDFIPSYLMGAVEGESKINPSEVRNQLEFMQGLTSLYIYPEQHGSGYGRIRFIYPARSGQVLTTPTNDSIRKLLADSFSDVGTTEQYADFENSRLIKNVIYAVTQKKTRELKRPLFDPRKIAILEKLGIVDSSGEISRLREEVSIEDLEVIYSRQKQAGHELATHWIASPLKVKG